MRDALVMAAEALEQTTAALEDMVRVVREAGGYLRPAHAAAYRNAVALLTRRGVTTEPVPLYAPQTPAWAASPAPWEGGYPGEDWLLRDIVAAEGDTETTAAMAGIPAPCGGLTGTEAKAVRAAMHAEDYGVAFTMTADVARILKGVAARGCEGPPGIGEQCECQPCVARRALAAAERLGKALP